jgi:hypothetical protein
VTGYITHKLLHLFTDIFPLTSCLFVYILPQVYIELPVLTIIFFPFRTASLAVSSSLRLLRFSPLLHILQLLPWVLIRRTAAQKICQGVRGYNWGRCIDAGQEETRWPAWFSQASMAGGSGPELKDGVSEAAVSGWVLLLNSRSAHTGHPEMLCGLDGLWMLPVGHTDLDNQLGHVQGLLHRTYSLLNKAKSLVKSNWFCSPWIFQIYGHGKNWKINQTRILKIWCTVKIRLHVFLFLEPNQVFGEHEGI